MRVGQQHGVPNFAHVQAFFVGFLGAAHAASEKDEITSRMDGPTTHQGDGRAFDHAVDGQDTEGGAFVFQ